MVIYLKCIMWSFDMSVHCETISTINLINTFIISYMLSFFFAFLCYFFFPWWEHKFYSLSKFQLYNTVHFSHSVMSNCLRPHGLQHTRAAYPSPTPRVYSNSGPLNQWCHPTISSSVIPFSSCLQSFPGSGSFLMSQFFASGAQSIGVLALTSVLSMNIQDWSPLGWTGGISVQS